MVYACTNLSTILSQLDRHEEAVAVLDEARRLDIPESAKRVHYQNLGSALASKGDMKMAAEMFLRAGAGDDNQPKTAVNYDPRFWQS